MKISSFHVDGFGAFADFGADDIDTGLVVLLGPNEAGKSTLFDFLTGVLFGFPTRKDNPRFRPPVRGGRHGGRLTVLDDNGGHWVVQRHAGAQRSFSVRRPDGSEGDEASLRRALAGASLPLFEAVFAVGLDDLGHMHSLESDEVRELLFTASILGQRRSATTAMRRLEDARNELARPRREDARANRLASELESVRSELAAAREDARRYELLHREAAALDDELTAVRSRLKAARGRQHELQLLEMCRQHHRMAEEARRRLAALPDVGAGAVLLEQAASIRQLANDRSGHLERLAKLDDLRSSRRSIDASVQRRLARLGRAWTLERALEAGPPESLRDSVRASRDRLDQLRVALASAQALLAQADSDVAALPPVPTEADEPPSLASLEGRVAALAELRERLGEAELFAAEALADERTGSEVALRRDVDSPARAAAVVLAVCGVLAAVLAAALLAGGRPLLGAAALTLGALLLTAGSLTWHRLRPTAGTGLVGDRNGKAGATPAAAGDVAHTRSLERARQLERARERIAGLAALLALEQPVSRVDADQFGLSLQRERERRRALDAASDARAGAERRRAVAAERLAAATRASDIERDAYGQWCLAHGFDASASPAETLERLDELDEIREAAAARRRVDSALGELEPSVASFAQRWRRLRDDVTAAMPAERESLQCDGDDALLVDAALSRLADLLDGATSLLASRASLEGERASAEAALAGSLGTGTAAERLRSQLADGDVLSWAVERSGLEEAADELRSSEEQLVRDHQSLAGEMRRLAASETIAELERRREALEADLESVLKRYLVLGTAHSLLRRTLAQHERERQPAVVAEAAAHFRRVTGGRYVGLLAGAGTEGHQAIRVLTAGGEAIEAHHLSRGTIEQLYLCLRLGLADSFAERSVSLPIVLDDVLVNFDPERAAAVADELAESSRSHQNPLPHLPSPSRRGDDAGGRAPPNRPPADPARATRTTLRPGRAAGPHRSGSATGPAGRRAVGQNWVSEYGGLSLANMRFPVVTACAETARMRPTSARARTDTPPR